MDDAAVIRALRRGDPLAFDALYAATRGPVYRYACALAGSIADADDLFQEAMLGLVRNADRLDETRPVLPYLLASVRNRHRDRLRQPALRSAGSGATTDPRGSGSTRGRPTVTNRSAIEHAEHAEQLREVRQAIQALPETEAEVVRLHLYGELSYEEIARAVEAPAATVRNRYRSALARLRRALGRLVRDD